MTVRSVGEFYRNFKLLRENAQNDLFLQVWASDNLTRVFVLIAANYYESRVKEILREFFESRSNTSLIWQFSNSLIEYQFNSLFAWKEANANHFFQRFGETFSSIAKHDVKTRPELDQGIKAFLLIGRIRNDLTHKELVKVVLDKTIDEFYDLHKKALLFINYLRRRLVENVEMATFWLQVE